MTSRLAKIDKRTSQYLNVLRGLSALIVFASHLYRILISRLIGPGLLETIITLSADYAVMVFFILSGFIISAKIKLMLQLSPHYFDWRSYFKARLVRLYPALAFSLLISLVIYSIIQQFKLLGATSYQLPTDPYQPNLIPKASLNLKQYALAWFFLADIEINKPLWSLVYEFWYYLLAMAVVSLRVNGFSAGMVILIAAILGYFSLQPLHSMYLLGLVWCAGALLAEFYERRYLYSSIYIFWAVFASLLLAGIAGYIFLSYEVAELSTLHMFLQMLWSWIIMLGLSLLLPWFSKIKWADNPITNYFIQVSHYSYTLYVIHVPLTLFAFSLLGPLIQCLVLYQLVAFTLILAVAIILVSRRLASVLELHYA